MYLFGIKRSGKNLVSGLLLLSVLLGLTACSEQGNRAHTSDQRFVVGLVTNNPNGMRNVEGFRAAMAKLGYADGENVEYRYPGKPVRGQALEQTLTRFVEDEVDLIFTAGSPTGVAAHRITQESEIPVVFGVIADPKRAGVMDDLSQPGGNMTGVMLSPNHSRRLELLLETDPTIKRVFVPYNPEDSAPASAFSYLETAAAQLGIEIIAGRAVDQEQVAALLNSVPTDIDALFLLPDSTVNRRQQDFIDLAIERRLPASGPSIIQVEKGALISYGIVHTEAGAQAAAIADQILKGARPGQLPVQTAEFYLGVNLQTARAIDLEVPYDVLQRAHTIIRANGDR